MLPGAGTQSETSLDFAFAEYAFSDALKFRIGAVKQPFGIGLTGSLSVGSGWQLQYDLHGGEDTDDYTSDAADAGFKVVVHKDNPARGLAKSKIALMFMKTTATRRRSRQPGSARSSPAAASPPAAPGDAGHQTLR